MYSSPAKTIMKAIYEVASQLDIVITIKNSDYRIKCHRRNPRKLSSAYNSQLETMLTEANGSGSMSTGTLAGHG